MSNTRVIKVRGYWQTRYGKPVWVKPHSRKFPQTMKVESKKTTT